MQVGQYMLMTLMVAVLLTPVWAGDDNRRGRPKQPPAEALEACSAQIEGDACSFVGRREKTLSGVCLVVPEEQLACVPEGHRRGRKSEGVTDDDTDIN